MSLLVYTANKPQSGPLWSFFNLITISQGRGSNFSIFMLQDSDLQSHIQQQYGTQTINDDMVSTPHPRLILTHLPDTRHPMNKGTMIRACDNKDITTETCNKDMVRMMTEWMMKMMVNKDMPTLWEVKALQLSDIITHIQGILNEWFWPLIPDHSHFVIFPLGDFSTHIKGFLHSYIKQWNSYSIHVGDLHDNVMSHVTYDHIGIDKHMQLHCWDLTTSMNWQPCIFCYFSLLCSMWESTRTCRLGPSYDMEDVGIFLACLCIGTVRSPVFAGFVQATLPALLSVFYNNLVLTLSKSMTLPACISLALWPST